jgi:TolA-binding protein/flagellar biosynthesis chaperone FliJ
MRTTAATRRRAGAALAIAAIVLGSGCAYFNTFYNAKSQYKHAEHDRVKRAGNLGLDGYQKCIEKCQLLLRYYPKSKYVDDALFLMGMSRYHRGEFVQARAAFEELEQRFPDSEYIERAYYNMGLAALEQGDAGGAAQSFEKLKTKFPDSKLNVEAVFRTAESRLDAKDYDQARAELAKFIHDHPKSPLAAEAQLRVARTYYDEHRYAEAREEYGRALDMKITPEVRFEAQLNSALSQRALAEEVLSNPIYEATRRAERLAASVNPATRPVQTTTAPPRPPAAAPTNEGSAPDSEAVEPPVDIRAEFEAAAPTDSASLADSLSAQLAADMALAAADTQAVAPLTDEQKKQLEQAEREVKKVEEQLLGLRKASQKFGKDVDLDIELAVTHALMGQPYAAITDLDQIARATKATETAARARYEIGEVHRRLGEFDKARTAYDDALKENRQASVAELATRKSNAIGSRSMAAERLREKPEVLQRWKELAAEPATSAPPSDTTGAADKLGKRIQAQAAFEDLASQQLRIAEIDLLELDQPLVALSEFEQILADYPGSMQEARAAFGIAWIYDHRLRDVGRAKTAYESVARDHADTPQGREARDILASWDGRKIEEKPPSERP